MAVRTRNSATAEKARVSGRYAVQGHSRSLDISSHRKLVCNFLLVNNTKLHPVSHRFTAIAQYWWNYCLWQGCLSLMHTLSVTSANIAITQN